MKTTKQHSTEELTPSESYPCKVDPSDKEIAGGCFPDSEDLESDDLGAEEYLIHSKRHGYYLRRGLEGHIGFEFRRMSRADIMRWLVDRQMIKNMGIRKEFHALMDAAGIGGKRIQTAR